MKRFTFRLDRVREWREKEFAMAEAQLEKLLAERGLVESRLRVLNEEAAECVSVLNRKTAIDPLELRAIDAFQRHATVQRGVIAQLLAECDTRIAAQRANVLEARRRCELLDKLREKQWQRWNVDLAREMEIEAGELFLAKWSGESS